MARRVLVAVAAFALCGCPHDWSSFEDVPGGEGRSESPTEPAPAPSGSSSSTSSSPSGAPSNDAVVFAEPSGEHPTLVVADGEGIAFLTREGSVMACPHAGCSPIGHLASAQKDVRGLAVSGAWAAWTARGENAVRRTPRAAGGAIDQIYEDDGLVAVGLTASKVYFSTEADFPFGMPAMRSCSPGIDCDSNRRDVAEGFVTDLVIDGLDAFWIEDRDLFSCPLAACENDTEKKTTLLLDVVEKVGLAVDAANVYFLGKEGGGELRALPRAGGPVHTIAGGVGVDARIAVAKQSVWIMSPSARTLSRVPIAGGGVTVVASNLAVPRAIAAGGDGVYVACEGDGHILRWKAEP